MTETTTATSAAPREAMKCGMDKHMGNPCQREATEKAWDEMEPMRCPFHQKVNDLARRMDGFYHALVAINGYLEDEQVKDDPFGVLHQAVYELRDRIVGEAGETAQKLKVAEIVAMFREDEPPDPSENRDKAEHIVRADALSMARALLLDEAPNTTGDDRLVALWAVEAAHNEANGDRDE